MSQAEHPSGIPSFFYRWDIENLIFLKEDWSLCGVIFSLPQIENTYWTLNLHKKTDVFENGVDFFLQRKNDYGPPVVEIYYEISVICADGSFKRITPAPQPIRFLMETKGCPEIKSQSCFFGKDLIDLLKGNTLSVCCRMWATMDQKRINGLTMEMGYSQQISSFTRVGTCKRSHNWVIDRYSFRGSNGENAKLECKVDNNFVSLFWNGDSLSEERMQIELTRARPMMDRQYIICQIFLLDAKGNIAASIRDEHHFKFHINCREVQKLQPFLKRKWLTEKKDLYLPKDTLTLRLELETYNGSVYFGVTGFHTGGPCNTSKVPLVENMDCGEQNTASSALMEGLQRFYQERKFCDGTLQTQNSTFPVHKAVLSAQSSVFEALFERGQGTVHVNNLNDDTVHQILSFLYTNTVDTLEWESALKLYSASINYEIYPLKTACMTLIEATLNVSNVIEALILADEHQDEDLKSLLCNFILDHDSEILDTDIWKKFLQGHMKLAGETLHKIYLWKIKK